MAVRVNSVRAFKSFVTVDDDRFWKDEDVLKIA